MICNKIAAAGDNICMEQSQWAAIVRQNSPLVWRTVYRLLAHDADAADCFQETFVSAWRFSRRQTVRNWPALLQRLATMRALDHLRRRRRGEKHLSVQSNLNELPAAEIDPPAQVQSAELAEQLRKALADLPAQQSEIYCLRHLNGFSYEQIAEELEINVSAVGVNLHRATEKLRAALTPILSDETASNPR
jgi:RNA polymerase sigma-70 factor (ECF subfamily)